MDKQDSSETEGPNPGGLCMCGCGGRVPLASQTKRGLVRGKPVRYLRGHNIAPPSVGQPNPSGACACGCGETTPLAPNSDKNKNWVRGEHMPYVPGHGWAAWRERQDYPAGTCACGCGGQTYPAKATIKALGLVKGKPTKYLKGHGIKSSQSSVLHGNTKRCLGCGFFKALELFERDSRVRDGYATHCQHCRDTGNLSQTRVTGQHNRTGATREYYEAQVKAQGGVCAVCRKPESALARGGKRPRKLSMDHDHVTGLPRGALCSACNTAIGKLGDDPELIEAAAEYVRRWRESQVRLAS